MSEYIIGEWYGKQIKLFPSKCLNCKEVNYYPKSECLTRQFCCVPCRHAWSKKQNLVDLQCSYCGVSFKRKRHRLNVSRSGLYFCCRKHKDLSQRIGGLLKPSHYGSGNSSATYRRINKEAHGTACFVCGYYDNICTGIVEAHHIDRDRTNNKPENLIPLCPTCHAYINRGYKRLEGKHKLVLVKPIEEYLK